LETELAAILDVETLKALTNAGLEVNISREELREIAKEKPEMARVLLESGTHHFFEAHEEEAKSTSLMKAIKDEDLGLLALLLEFGCQAGGMQKAGFTPLTYALWLHYEKRAQIVDLLLSRGADVNETASCVIRQHPHQRWQDRSYMPEQQELLEESQHPSLGGFFISDGYKVNKLAPIHITAACESCADCKKLLTRLVHSGADPSAAFSFELSVTDRAIQHATKEMLAPALTNISVLHIAVHSQNLELLARLPVPLSAKDGLGHTPLAWTIMYGFDEGAKILLQAGAPLDDISQRGMGALELFYKLLLREDSASYARQRLILRALTLAGADSNTPSIGLDGNNVMGASIKSRVDAMLTRYWSSAHKTHLSEVAVILNRAAANDQAAVRREYLQKWAT
jgi:ankyrin repeat protein